MRRAIQSFFSFTARLTAPPRALLRSAGRLANRTKARVPVRKTPLLLAAALAAIHQAPCARLTSASALVVKAFGISAASSTKSLDTIYVPQLRFATTARVMTHTCPRRLAALSARTRWTARKKLGLFANNAELRIPMFRATPIRAAALTNP